MSLSIHTNYASLVTQTSLNKTNQFLTTNQQRLGTGLRINSAADDAAGLQIATRLSTQARGMAVAMRNVSDGISLLQTAEGAFKELTDIVQRMKDLSTQAANGTNSDVDRKSLQAEYDELGLELANIVQNTTYAGENLFDAASTGKFITGPIQFQIGGTSEEIMTLDASTELGDLISGLEGVSGMFDTGASGAEIETVGDANLNINAVGLTLDLIGALRAKLGATMNRLTHTGNNLANMKDNTEMAKGRIMDTDYAFESANMSKNSMLMQSSISMLKQASQMPSLVMSLLS